MLPIFLSLSIHPFVPLFETMWHAWHRSDLFLPMLSLCPRELCKNVWTDRYAVWRQTHVGPRNHAFDGGVHIGATWRIRLSDLCAIAMLLSNYFNHLCFLPLYLSFFYPSPSRLSPAFTILFTSFISFPHAPFPFCFTSHSYLYKTFSFLPYILCMSLLSVYPSVIPWWNDEK